MKKVVISLVLFLTAFTAQCQKVNVAAAANLRYVLEEIKTSYVKVYPKAVVNINYGSSGTLVQQIINGASFDFFMAADNEFPVKLKEKGLTTGQISTYAIGKLALYSTTIDVKRLGLKALNEPEVKKIAIANSVTAPYGERSEVLLKSQGLYDQLRSKIVVGENISQAAQFAFTGNAELGFVALSLALAPEMSGKGTYYIIPSNMYKPIEQACVLIKRSVLNTEAIRFRKYILSPAIKPIWEKYGYSVPN